KAPADEIYNPAPGAVGVDLIPRNSDPVTTRWLVTYSDGTSTTKFQIELSHPASNNLLPMGKGQLVSVPGSDPAPLLDALKEALEARRTPKHTQKVETLSFEYSLTGSDQSRALDGTFSTNPRGNWTTTKLTLAGGRAQVYFNFNPLIHKGEFAIKDMEYGDRLVAEFAKVL
ncbi:MAG TPA: hypothetical protein VJQ82_16045, partial [Terriglobales bacterium]|nr:hypothetical protein [Terriglobales bacterium]